MGKFTFTDRTITNKKKDVILSLAVSILLACSFILCINDMFGLSYGIKDAFSGTIGKGLICFNNRVASALGNSDYILINKLKGDADTTGIFLTVITVLTAACCYGILKSKKKLALLVVLIPAILPAVLFNLDISIMSFAMMTLSIITAIVYMGGDLSSVIKSFVFVLAVTIISLGILKIPQVSGFANGNKYVTAERETVQEKIADIYYGENLLKSGDLTQRERAKGDSTALEVTMQEPHSTYLRGFIGEKYTSKSWESLTPSNHYSDLDTMHWLSAFGFNALGQLGQTQELTDSAKEETGKVEISVKGADKRIAYIPYEIKSDIENGKSWGGSFVTPHKYGKLKKYTYEAGENPVENWTTTAAKLFTESKGEDIDEYMLSESYYNPMIYKNYTFVSPNDRKILRKALGVNTESVTSHMEYKKAIETVKDYLNSNFIYTEVLGDAEDSDMLKTFFEEKKGYDVQFATAATLMFRYYGIPARYVEGYLITPQDAEKMKADTAYSLPESRAHAWTEIYVDGIGFVPIEVSPAYEGVMKEADMNIGISNDSLKSSFEEQGGSSFDTYETGGDGKEHKKIDVMILMALLVLMLILASVLSALIKRIFGYAKDAYERHKLFVKAEPNMAVSAMFAYLEKHIYPISGEVRDKGNKAAYSRENLDEQDRKEMLLYVKEVKKERRKDDRKKLFKKNKTAGSSSSNGKHGLIRLRRKERRRDS